ncbi:hypothetical protein F2Q70_00039447 [Brassica cretica]|uniref:Uncharacterized protein n=1 Tax=Brassica cretica TaxID=69181 RepID=A0A8S9K303_BRACR|nr:hypothetical protein F2Q70_00039447 [Brassica cretica]
MNASEGTSRKSIRSKNPNSADKRLPSIDTPVSTSINSHSKPKLSLFTKKNMSIDYGFLTPDEFGIFRDPDGYARAMDGRILQVSREDIAYILQVANGQENLFMQQRIIPDNIPGVPDEYPRADTTEIGSHQSCRPVGQASIDKVAITSLDRKVQMGIWNVMNLEQKDEYGVYRDASGYARSVAEHATSFTPTKLAPEIYTKDEINEMVTVPDTCLKILASCDRYSQGKACTFIFMLGNEEISSELTIRGRYEEEAIVRCTSSVVDRYRREASTIEDYDRSIYILYHRSMSRREMRDLVPADFKPKASPNYKITPDEFLT